MINLIIIKTLNIDRKACFKSLSKEKKLLCSEKKCYEVLIKTILPIIRLKMAKCVYGIYITLKLCAKLFSYRNDLLFFFVFNSIHPSPLFCPRTEGLNNELPPPLSPLSFLYFKSESTVNNTLSTVHQTSLDVYF